MDEFPMPSNLVAADESSARDQKVAWMMALPEKVKTLSRRWSLNVGPPFQPGGRTAWVAPACDAANSDVVLKVGWLHTEAAHEVDGLREWDGEGVVRIYESAEFDDTIAMVIERCVPGTSLADRPEFDQDVVVAALLSRLWREPPHGHPFRPLQVMCDHWADAFERKIALSEHGLDSGLARDGIALLRSLPASAERNVLLCTDLHAENVLAARREPWLVIDPKPYVGDPTYDPLQHMLNCDERLLADPRGLGLRMADLLDLDGERLLLWLFARCVQESPDWPGLGQVARRIAPP
jgi:streptomycin 6-kinase